MSAESISGYDGVPAGSRPASPVSLIPSHSAVHDAVCRAQESHRRAVCVAEATENLTDRERALILAAYPSQRLNNAVHKIVAQMRARHVLVDRGVVGEYRYVAARALVAAGVPDGLPDSARRVQRGQRLLPAHAIVLGALEVANLAAARATTVSEVITALSAEETATVTAAYPGRALTLTVAKILWQLRSRGIVSSPGALRHARVYVAPRSLPDDRADELPDLRSRRMRTLECVRAAVTRLGRAVRVADVVAIAAMPDSEDRTSVSRTLLARDMANLAQTGELRVAGTVRGGGVDGTTLYLPAELESGAYVAREPLTWLEAVADAFAASWSDECSVARESGRRPRPRSTGAIRERLAEHAERIDNYSTQLSDAQCIANALQSLAEGTDPAVRKVRRTAEYRAILWAPAGVADDDLDIGDAHASDTERIAEAVRRACRASGAPAASRREIQSVVAAEPSLRPIGLASVANVLQDSAKEAVSRGAGDSVTRQRQRVVRAGCVGGVEYYAAPTAAPQSDAWRRAVAHARSYVSVRELQAAWSALRADERLVEAGDGTLSSLVLGRTLGVQAEIARVAAAVDGLLSAPRGAADPRTLVEARQLRAHIGVAAAHAADWVARRRDAWTRNAGAVATGAALLPEAADTTVPGWTAEELLPEFVDLYPRARTVTAAVELIPLLSKAIRRVPNPEFVARDRGGRAGAQYLFDRAAALLYAAKEWGGQECVMQAAFAEAALGEFRDARFVLPGLQERDVRARLTAVACLAYLRWPPGSAYLCEVATGDRDGGVRAAAVWAYGFSGAEGVEALLAAVADDPHPRVEALVTRARRKSPVDWWRL